MITFILSLAIYLQGIFFDSKYLERMMEVDPNMPTPAVSMSDGVDFVPMTWWRVLLIFGAIAGVNQGKMKK